MIVTYTKTYREVVIGNGWVLMSDVSSRDSLIVHHLHGLVKNKSKATFEDLYDILREAYKNKTFRSRCSISNEDDRIEVIVRGVFPKFYIEKK